MPPGGFETEIPATELSQTQALDRATTGIGANAMYETYFTWKLASTLPFSVA